MALTESQKKYVKVEFQHYLKDRNLLLSNDFEKIILDFFDEQNILFNYHLKDIALRMTSIVHSANGLSASAFKAQLKDWGNLYKQYEAEASILCKEIHAAQPKGITALLNRQQPVGTVWCDDIDIKACLKKVITQPETIKGAQLKGGELYILPPAALDDQPSLTSYLAPLLVQQKKRSNQQKSSQLSFELRIPLAYHGHWYLATIKVAGGKIKRATLWDSLNGGKENPGSAFDLFKQQLKSIDTQLADSALKQVVANVQSNSWSCGDYVMQQAIKDLKSSCLTEPLVVLANANDSQALREAVIHSIKGNNPLWRLSQHDKISFFSETLPQHLQKNSRALIDFDYALARRFSELINDQEAKDNETQLFEQARQCAYEELKETYKLHSLLPKK